MKYHAKEPGDKVNNDDDDAPALAWRRGAGDRAIARGRGVAPRRGMRVLPVLLALLVLAMAPLVRAAVLTPSGPLPWLWSSGPGPWFVADVDGDGRDDFVRLSGGTASVALAGGDRAARLTAGDGDKPVHLAAFREPTPWSHDPCSVTEDCGLADVDGDGRADLVNLGGGGVVEVAPSTGARFGELATWASGCGADERCYLGDFDGDGRADLLRQRDGVARIARSTGSSFVDGLVFTFELCEDGCTVGDFDGDGADDVLAPRPDGLRVARGVAGYGSVFVEDLGAWRTAADVNGLTVGRARDMDGDGRADPVVATATGFAVVRSGEGGGSFRPWLDPVAPDACAAAATCAPADVNGDGAGDVVSLDGDAVAVALGEVLAPSVRVTAIIEAPSDRTLTEVTLVVDDTSIPEADSKIPLWPGCAPDLWIERDVEIRWLGDVIIGTRYRLRFELPMWQAGGNHARIQAVFDGSTFELLHGTFEPPPEQHLAFFLYPRNGAGFEVPLPGGARPVRFEVPGVPILTLDCHAAICKDADGDGLLDLWENLATEVLRPQLMLSDGEELFEHEGHTVAALTRATAARDAAGTPWVVLMTVLAWSDDYGAAPYDGGHHGDTQPLQLYWRVDREHPGTVVLERARMLFHDCITCGVDSAQYDWSELRYTADGIPLVYVEEDKHGTLPSMAECDDESLYSCGRRPLRPAAFNVGESAARAFVDRFADTPWEPHRRLAAMFPGEAVWSPGDHRHARFCGGLGWDGECAPLPGSHLGGPPPTMLEEEIMAALLACVWRRRSDLCESLPGLLESARWRGLGPLWWRQTVCGYPFTVSPSDVPTVVPLPTWTDAVHAR